MLGEPSASQLAQAVGLYLEQVVSKLDGHAAFHGRVALNVLATIQRELEHGPAAAAAERARLANLLGCDGELDTLRRALVDEIRAGRMDEASPGLVDHLLTSAADRVRIEQPTYASLKRAT